MLSRQNVCTEFKYLAAETFGITVKLCSRCKVCIPPLRFQSHILTAPPLLHSIVGPNGTGKSGMYLPFVQQCGVCTDD